MKAKLILASLVLALAALPLNAQFFSQGSDPGGRHWSQLETETYRVVFPSGLDSLARVYASWLEASCRPVASGLGFIPNASYTRRQPVILHPYSTGANGLVTWAPRRMELFTVPEAYAPIAMNNELQLTIHESRHAAQMQFGAARPFRWAGILFGEMAPGALSGIYCGPHFLEGDAVLAETALSGLGRGRDADFLEYYRVSFDEGKDRDFWQWRWGSRKLYTPDYYRAGYILMAGMRTQYDAPDFTQRYFERLRRHHGFAIGNLQKTIRETSGKGLRESFAEITDSMKDEWASDTQTRGPFDEVTAVTSDRAFFTSYNGLEVVSDDIYAIRSGMDEVPRLIHISADGKERTVALFATRSSRLQYDEDFSRLYWSEEIPDHRWELRSFSDIRYIDNSSRIHRLTKGGRFFNPAPRGSRVAVVEYPVEGGSKAVLLDADSGTRISSTTAPDGLQLVEPVWVGEELFASAISPDGFGIYRLRDFKCVLGPSHVKVKQLFSRDGRIFFTSDLGGVNELYSLEPGSGRLLRLTNTRNGASDFRLNGSGDTFYCTVMTSTGRNITRIPAGSLKPTAADFGDTHSYAMADKLSATETVSVVPTEVEGEVTPYNKAAHLFKFHSWAPLYVDYDAISSMSFENIDQSAGLGATAFFQNELGDAWGSVAYHAGHNADGWHHSGHARFIYRGWYPVIEAGLDVGDRYSKASVIKNNDKGGTSISSSYTGRPLASYSIKAYVPFNFSGGGLNCGLIPQIKLAGSNDTFEGHPTMGFLASVRGYVTEKTPVAGIYPRLGIGVEAGFYSRPGLTGYFCPNVFGHAYAYLPGIGRTHGIRLSATIEKHLVSGNFVDATASVMPRGFASSAGTAVLGYPVRSKLSFDYALPFADLDWSGLCPAFYLKNFELFIHGDLFNASGAKTAEGGNLFSAGADFKVRLANFLFVPYDTRIGISYNYNGGSLYGKVAEAAPATGRHSVSLIFSVDL